MAGANDRVRVAVCGIRGQGFAHIEEYSRLDNVEVAAVCDVDDNIVRQRLADMDRLGMPTPKVYTDPRRVMEDKSIDAVSIATPNHWHALVTIWACQAGKDVYVEKPCSHFWWEGRQMVRAAEKYNRIVQHGANSRRTRLLSKASKIQETAIARTWLRIMFAGGTRSAAFGSQYRPVSITNSGPARFQTLATRRTSRQRHWSGITQRDAESGAIKWTWRDGAWAPIDQSIRYGRVPHVR